MEGVSAKKVEIGRILDQIRCVHGTNGIHVYDRGGDNNDLFIRHGLNFIVRLKRRNLVSWRRTWDSDALASQVTMRCRTSVCFDSPQHAYCDLGYRGHDCEGGCDVQVVNRFRRHKPRAILRWWKRRSAIEPVIGHVKSDHRMERNMLAGAAGDRINAMLAAVGFNLVKLMRGLKRLFLCLRTEVGGFAAFLAELVWTVMDAGLAEPVPLRCRRKITNQGFA